MPRDKHLGIEDYINEAVELRAKEFANLSLANRQFALRAAIEVHKNDTERAKLQDILNILDAAALFYAFLAKESQEKQ